MKEKTDTQKAIKKQEDLICIVCPRGCRLTAQTTEAGLELSGNFCPRGKEYGLQEVTNPVRVLTALMRVRDTEKPVSVRTDRPVPRSMLLAGAAEIYRTHPAPPVRRGDILIRDLCGTGCNVIATRNS